MSSTLSSDCLMIALVIFLPWRKFVWVAEAELEDHVLDLRCE